MGVWAVAVAAGVFLLVSVGTLRVVLIVTGHDGDELLAATFTGVSTAVVALIGSGFVRMHGSW